MTMTIPSACSSCSRYTRRMGVISCMGNPFLHGKASLAHQSRSTMLSLSHLSKLFARAGGNSEKQARGNQLTRRANQIFARGCRFLALFTPPDVERVQ